MAQSQAVAALVVGQLGLPQSVGSFQAASTVTIVTNNVLLFNVGAPSASDAMARVTALATEFLKYRAQYELAVQQQAGGRARPAVQPGPDEPRFDQRADKPDIGGAQLAHGPGRAGQAGDTAQRTGRDRAVRDRPPRRRRRPVPRRWCTTARCSAPPLRSRARTLKGAALYVAGGLFGGLAVGMIIVIITALVSDRLRRRDDVAEALGAPVRLSVGPLRRRRRPGRPGRAAKRDRDMKRVVAHLRRTVPGRSRGRSGLVVVAVDNAKDVAPAVDVTGCDLRA